MASSAKNFFCLILQGLNLLVGSDMPQKKILRGIGPPEQDPAGYQTPQNQVLQGIRPSRTMTEMCIFIADACSAGSDTPHKIVLWGLILRLTKSC
jgi:hypothetical protein